MEAEIDRETHKARSRLFHRVVPFDTPRPRFGCFTSASRITRKKRASDALAQARARCARAIGSYVGAFVEASLDHFGPSWYHPALC